MRGQVRQVGAPEPGLGEVGPRASPLLQAWPRHAPGMSRHWGRAASPSWLMQREERPRACSSSGCVQDIESPVLPSWEDVGRVKFDIRYISLLPVKPLRLFVGTHVFWLRFSNCNKVGLWWSWAGIGGVPLLLWMRTPALGLLPPAGTPHSRW